MDSFRSYELSRTRRATDTENRLGPPWGSGEVRRGERLLTGTVFPFGGDEDVWELETVAAKHCEGTKGH